MKKMARTKGEKRQADSQTSNAAKKAKHEEDIIFPDEGEEREEPYAFNAVLERLVREVSIRTESNRLIDVKNREIRDLSEKAYYLEEKLNDMTNQFKSCRTSLVIEQKKRRRGDCCICLNAVQDSNSVHACRVDHCDSWMHLKCYMRLCRGRNGHRCPVCRAEYDSDNIAGTVAGEWIARQRRMQDQIRAEAEAMTREQGLIDMTSTQ